MKYVKLLKITFPQFIVINIIVINIGVIFKATVFLIFLYVLQGNVDTLFR